jgi:probable rRNA maturation factor
MNDKLSVQTSDKYSSYIDDSKIRHAVRKTLEYSKSSDQISLTIVFQEDELLRRMNKQFLEIDAPTDVLSFPADYKDPETQENYLGDVLISVPRAIEQASAGNHTVEDELQLLVVHGVLHLLGYDHIEETDKERMQAAQSTILQLLGNNLEVSL